MSDQLTAEELDWLCNRASAGDRFRYSDQLIATVYAQQAKIARLREALGDARVRLSPALRNIDAALSATEETHDE